MSSVSVAAGGDVTVKAPLYSFIFTATFLCPSTSDMHEQRPGVLLLPGSIHSMLCCRGDTVCLMHDHVEASVFCVYCARYMWR